MNTDVNTIDQAIYEDETLWSLYSVCCIAENTEVLQKDNQNLILSLTT